VVIVGLESGSLQQMAREHGEPARSQALLRASITSPAAHRHAVSAAGPSTGDCGVSDRQLQGVEIKTASGRRRADASPLVPPRRLARRRGGTGAASTLARARAWCTPPQRSPTRPWLAL
jgi:hypothetical protein